MLQPVLKFIFSCIPCFSQQMEEMFFLSMIHITDRRMIKNGEKPSRLDFALRYWHPSSTDVSDPRSKLSHNCQAKKKSNDKNRGLEVGNGCGLTPPSLAALYISRCFSLRLWNDIYVFFCFFFQKNQDPFPRTAKLGAGQEFTRRWDSGRSSCQNWDAHIPSKLPENWARDQLVFHHTCCNAPFVQVTQAS